MKKFFLLFGFITFATLLTNAQQVVNSGNGREKMKMLEIGYFTRQLQLSSNEAEKFWPMYEQYRQELKTLMRDRSIADELERQQKALDIRKKYRVSFEKILDKVRGVKVFETQDNFQSMVRKEMQQRRKMRQNNPQSQN